MYLGLNGEISDAENSLCSLKTPLRYCFEQCLQNENFYFLAQ